MYKRLSLAATAAFRFYSSSPVTTLSTTSHLPLLKQLQQQPLRRLDPIFSRPYIKTRTTMAFPTPTVASSEVLSKAATSHDSTYKVLYFGIHGRAEIIRNLLGYGDAKWEELPIDWPAQKTKTPFQCVPVVFETTADGTILELAEAQAIERYLAKKYHLMGKNAWEEHKVNEFFTSTDGAMLAFHSSVLRGPNGPIENQVEGANKFYAEVLAKFVALHEAYLAKNGSNGHYVGHQTTLADIKTSTFIDRLLLLHPTGAHEVGISKDKTPNLWKVRETVHAHPSFKKWIDSARYKELDVSTRKMFIQA
ncbi:hypothetical protein EMPS_09171 [Entomortierella parvispora]|uniref:glutathione transferase n=1 Tax=Entomortierella parvispora TaxID=205924 RepID=A0A9P3HHP3_9FUNG|nr:hypothetical protein EMPS_09171 [Entomortierella parvispora]